MVDRINPISQNQVNAVTADAAAVRKRDFFQQIYQNKISVYSVQEQSDIPVLTTDNALINSIIKTVNCQKNDKEYFNRIFGKAEFTKSW